MSIPVLPGQLELPVIEDIPHKAVRPAPPARFRLTLTADDLQDLRMIYDLELAITSHLMPPAARERKVRLLERVKRMLERLTPRPHYHIGVDMGGPDGDKSVRVVYKVEGEKVEIVDVREVRE